MTKQDVLVQLLHEKKGIEKERLNAIIEAAKKKEPCTEFDEELTEKKGEEYLSLMRKMPGEYVEIIYKGILGHAMLGGTSERH